METSRFASRSIIRIALVLVCVVSVGCGHRGTTVCTGNQSHDCGKKDIFMDTTNGVDKPDVCVCGGDKVEWHETDSNNQRHQFRVEFKNGSPFPGQTVFDNNSGPSNGANDYAAPTAFKYDITVDGNKHDPRVVGGGGHP